MFTKLAAFLICAIAFQGHAYDKHSINWPTPMSPHENHIGPILHQFQKFSDSYFHEGVDILTSQNQNVFSPVSGVVDAGYYSYKTLSNGLSEKTYLSLRDIDRADTEPKLWGERYFEVSVTDNNQLRFEFHHIKRESLSADLIEKIYTASQVAAGDILGKVVEWPEKVRGVEYNHIHYSILNTEGIYLNPFWYSTQVPDETPPTVTSVYASVSQRCPANGLRQLKELSQLSSLDEVTHLVLQTQDYLGKSPFPQPPTKLTAVFEDGFKYTFDYSEALFTNPLNSYTLDQIYVGKFCIGAPDFPFVIPGSESFKFYIQIPVPKDFHGKIDVLISDFSNNTTELKVEL